MVPETVAPHGFDHLPPPSPPFLPRFTEFPSDTSQQTFLRSLPEKGGKGGERCANYPQCEAGHGVLPHHLFHHLPLAPRSRIRERIAPANPR